MVTPWRWPSTWDGSRTNWKKIESFIAGLRFNNAGTGTIGHLASNVWNSRIPGKLPPDDLHIKRALAAMDHRGPDAHGVYQEQLGSGRSVVLLHTRLSVLDTSDRAAQPFRSGESALSFNGEIFNFYELRNELVTRGARFLSDGDTEVLAQLLETEGSDALDRCEGMWRLHFFQRKPIASAIARPVR